MTDDWDDRSERTLPLRTADDTEGSELPDERDGELSPASGDCMKLPGELDNSCDSLTQGFAGRSPICPLEGILVFGGKGDGVAGPCGIGGYEPLGVGGGGG